MRPLTTCSLLLTLYLVPACSSPEPRQDTTPQDMQARTEEDAASSADMPASDMESTQVKPDQASSPQPAIRADVTKVTASGGPGAYQFSVTLASTETGCEQYADWWEVLTPQGELLYRRILGHSHVNEQPFTRSGGPIDADAGQKVIVRAHMNHAGFVGQAMEVTLTDPISTSPLTLEQGFASALEQTAPLPSGCAF